VQILTPDALLLHAVARGAEICYELTKLRLYEGSIKALLHIQEHSVACGAQIYRELTGVVLLY
jgi:hypothetical protein